MSSPATSAGAAHQASAPRGVSFAGYGWRIARALYAQLDLLATALLTLIVLYLYRRFPLPTDVATFYPLDESWVFDTFAKARQGIWLGKDVLLTYGPLFQLCFVPVFWLNDLSLGEHYKLWHFVPIWTTILLVYGSARFLLPQVEPWKRALYILLLVIFWAQFEIKSCAALFVFTAFLWAQERAPAGNRRMPLYALLSALLMTAAFLLSADTGFYAVAAFFLTGICYGGYRLPRRQARLRSAIFLALVPAVFFVCMLSVNAIFGRIWDFKYWVGCYKIVSGYRWFAPLGMDPETTRMLAIGVVICLSIFLWTWIVCRRSSQEPSLSPRVLSVALFSLLVLQSCIVRSTWRTVTVGLFVVIALAMAFLFGPLSRKPTGATTGVPVLLALALTVVFAASPYEAFSPAAILQAWKSSAAPPMCPQDKLPLDQACLALEDFLPLNAASTFLREHAPASESVMIFPYENVYGDIARRRVAGGVLQSYLIADPFLLDQQLKGLERDHPGWGIYSADYLGSGPMDGVPNFTRTPEVWLYQQSHFHRVANLELGILGLQRDEDRIRRWNMETAQWPLAPVRQRVQAGKDIQLAQLHSWPQQDVDFLKLRIEVHSPPWWRVLKPASMTFSLQRADGTSKIVHAIAKPDHPHEIWIYPWSEYQLMNYFFENPSDWRKRGVHPPITSISVRFDRQDWLSVLPSEVELQGVDAVRVSLR